MSKPLRGSAGYSKAQREFFLCTCPKCIEAQPWRERVKKEREQHTRFKDMRGRTHKR